MEKITLRLPVKDVFIVQPFGVNYLDFYQKLGMKGHNGVDFRARNSCPIYAAHGGIVYYCGTDSNGGIEVDIWNLHDYKTIYYHLKNYCVTQGQEILSGQLIGYADNTGLYTTGDHLHFALKETKADGSSKNLSNGYNGAINPAPFFTETYNGFPIGNKDWDKSRCYHRYYRVAKRNLANEMKTALYMAKKLKRLPKNEEINAAIWGGWDINTIMNESMYEIWSQLKKSEYLEGQRQFS